MSFTSYVSIYKRSFFLLTNAQSSMRYFFLLIISTQPTVHAVYMMPRDCNTNLLFKNIWLRYPEFKYCISALTQSTRRDHFRVYFCLRYKNSWPKKKLLYSMFDVKFILRWLSELWNHFCIDSVYIEGESIPRWNSLRRGHFLESPKQPCD